MNLHATSEVIESVHNLLINKVYYARCNDANEFLRTVTKLACIDKGKGIDGNVLLRDELKVCALKKMSDDVYFTHFFLGRAKLSKCIS